MHPAQRDGIIAILLVATLGIGIALLIHPTSRIRVVPALDAGETYEWRRSAAKEASEQGDTFAPRTSIDTRILYRILASDDLPVSDALITILSTRKLLSQHTTDRTGHATIDGPETGDAVVLVRATGFAVHHGQLRRPFPSHVEVRLEEAHSIRGVVRLDNGDAPPVPVVIMAWPSEQEPPPSAFVGDEPTLRLPSTRTDSSGRFVLDSLDPSSTYSVAAGAPGWTTKTIATSVRPTSGQEIHLILWRVHACLVRVREGNGDLPPRANAFSRLELPGSLTRKSMRIGPDSVDASLAGLGLLPGIENPTDYRDYLLAYKSATQSVIPELAGIHFSILGYAPATARVPVFPVAGPIPIRTIVLERTVDGFGSLRIRLSREDVTGHRPRIQDRDAVAAVLLEPVTGGTTLSLDLYDLTRHEKMVEGVPAGDYWVSLRGLKCNYVDPEATQLSQLVQVRPSSHSVVEFDVSTLCYAELVPTTNSGMSLNYDEQIVVTIHDTSEAIDVSRKAYFGGRPYVLQGLVPGEYDMVICEAVGQGRRWRVKVHLANSTHSVHWVVE